MDDDAKPVEVTGGLLGWVIAATRDNNRDVLENSPELRRRVGRPTKSDDHDLDQVRALLLYAIVHIQQPKRLKLKIDPKIIRNETARELVIKVKNPEWRIKLKALNIAEVSEWIDYLFAPAHGTLEQSVSRGKRKLNITKGWQSETCAKLLRLVK